MTCLSVLSAKSVMGLMANYKLNIINAMRFARPLNV